MASENSVKIIYNCTENKYKYDFRSLNNQYVKTLSFIETTSDSHKFELTQLVCPIFIQFYLEFLSEYEKEDADKFYDLHSSLFLETPGYKDLIKNLKTLNNVGDIFNDGDFRFFRTDKYIVRLSEDSVTSLRNFLSDNNVFKVLQFLDLYFTLDYTDELNEENSFKEQQNVFKIPPVFDTNQIQSAIKDLNQLSPPFPSIYLYSISDISSLCSVDLNYDRTMLAGGLANTCIYLWQLEKTSLDFGPEELINNKLNSSDMSILRGHGGPVYSVSFLPSDDLLLSGSSDCTIRLWKIGQCKLELVYKGHQESVYDIVLDPYNQKFISASEDSTVLLWDIKKNESFQAFIGHESSVRCLSFQHNSKSFASGSSDKTIRLWNTQEKSPISILNNLNGSITSLSFSPDGKYLVSADDNSEIKIWDLSFQTVIQTFKSKLNFARKMTFTNDGNTLIVSGVENFIEFYNLTELNGDHKPFSDDVLNKDYLSNRFMGTYHDPEFSFRFVRFEDHFLSAVGVICKTE